MSASQQFPVNNAPFWRGFNLLEKFSMRRGAESFREEDFACMAEWGFNWVRLPMTYMAWTQEDDLYALKEDALRQIDQAVELGRQYGLHVNISFHRAPGYSVNRERTEPFNLWTDPAALDCCSFHWRHFAQRYKGISGDRLSFNLWNEPGTPGPDFRPADHARVAREIVAAIRKIDPDRPIVADGLDYGRIAMPELADLHVIQSCRGYYPLELTHFRASWNDPGYYPQPIWPIRRSKDEVEAVVVEHYRKHPQDGEAFELDRSGLEKFYQPWVDLMAKGVGVHCGEMGAYSRTPHAVVLAWMEDLLSVLKQRSIGWGLWNLRGSFGILDSERDDVAYETFHGHRLDRAMLELLQRF